MEEATNQNTNNSESFVDEQPKPSTQNQQPRQPANSHVKKTTKKLPRLVLFLVLLFVAVVGYMYMSSNSNTLGNKQSLQDNSNNIVCTKDAKQCSDGSIVGRVPPSCEFEACPVAEVPVRVERKTELERPLSINTLEVELLKIDPLMQENSLNEVFEIQIPIEANCGDMGVSEALCLDKEVGEAVSGYMVAGYRSEGALVDLERAQAWWTNTYAPVGPFDYYATMLRAVPANLGVFTNAEVFYADAAGDTLLALLYQYNDEGNTWELYGSYYGFPVSEFDNIVASE